MTLSKYAGKWIQRTYKKLNQKTHFSMCISFNQQILGLQKNLTGSTQFPHILNPKILLLISWMYFFITKNIYSLSAVPPHSFVNSSYILAFTSISRFFIPFHWFLTTLLLLQHVSLKNFFKQSIPVLLIQLCFPSCP